MILYIITLSALLLAVMKVNVYEAPYEDLIEAIENGNLKAAQSALRNGADANKMGCVSPYRTPLIITADEGKENLAKLLVEYGVDVNAKEHYGDTALMWAANSGHLNVAEYLVEHGANVNAKTTGPISAGSTALIYASEM